MGVKNINESSVKNRWLINSDFDNDNIDETKVDDDFRQQHKVQHFDNYLVDDEVIQKITKTTGLLDILRLGSWLLVVFIHICYFPLYIYRLFGKPTACPPIKNDLLLLPAAVLAQKIRRKKIKSVDIVQVYINRINEVNPVLNCVIENRFAQAIEDAKRADLLIESGKYDEDYLQQKLPLLGIPLTVKGSIEVKGLSNTSGLLSRKDFKANEDAVAVHRARSAGAIPLLVSNVPELCLNWETRNKLIGTTLNPYNTTRTSGGSSGGEAALISSGASIIGIGSDVAGSLRLPSHFCGICAHKPSPGAVSFIGHYPISPTDMWRQIFTLGPMARHVGDLKILLKTILEDGFMDKLKLDHTVDVDKVKIFFIYDINNFISNSTNEDGKNAVNKVVQHFGTHHCRKLDERLFRFTSEIATIHLLSLKELEYVFGQEHEKSLTEVWKYLLGRSQIELSTILFGIFKHFHRKLPETFIEENNSRLEFLKQELIRILGDNGVLIMPCYPTEARPHFDYIRKAFNHSYLSIFNSLGFPVTICRVSFSRDNLPIGVQIISAPNCDRLTLAIAEDLEKTFGGWKQPS